MKVYVTTSVHLSETGLRIGAQLDCVFSDKNLAITYVQSRVIDFLLSHQSDTIKRVNKDCSGNRVFISVFSIDGLLYSWSVHEKDVYPILL